MNLSATQVYTHNTIDRLKSIYKQKSSKYKNFSIMKVEIQSIRFNPDRKLVDFVNKKIDKISAIDDGLIKTDVFLKIDKPESPENKIRNSYSLLKRRVLCKKQCDTFEESIYLSVQAKKTSVKTERKIVCFARSTFVFLKFILNFVCIIKNFNTFANLFRGEC